MRFNNLPGAKVFWRPFQKSEISVSQWHKDPGATMVFIMVIGAGGAGGAGAVAGGGGGGGGSGGQAMVIVPAAMLPDTLFYGSESVGILFVGLDRALTGSALSYCLAQAGGDGASPTTGGTAGAAPLSNMILAQGFPNAVYAGQAGAAGGASGVAGTAITYPTTGLLPTGGAGGGGSGQSGGGVTASAPRPGLVSSFANASSHGVDFVLGAFLPSGGVGGYGNGNAVLSAGGDGGFGCGGGGGGGGASVASPGGKGGPGLIVIAQW